MLLASKHQSFAQTYRELYHPIQRQITFRLTGFKEDHIMIGVVDAAFPRSIADRQNRPPVRRLGTPRPSAQQSLSRVSAAMQKYPPPWEALTL